MGKKMVSSKKKMLRPRIYKKLKGMVIVCGVNIIWRSSKLEIGGQRLVIS
jgi:hypothetical protein